MPQIKTRVYLNQKLSLIRFVKIIGVQKQLSISFGIALIRNKILKVKHLHHTYTNFYLIKRI